jgi:hypothetical protein
MKKYSLAMRSESILLGNHARSSIVDGETSPVSRYFFIFVALVLLVATGSIFWFVGRNYHTSLQTYLLRLPIFALFVLGLWTGLAVGRKRPKTWQHLVTKTSLLWLQENNYLISASVATVAIILPYYAGAVIPGMSAALFSISAIALFLLSLSSFLIGQATSLIIRKISRFAVMRSLLVIISIILGVRLFILLEPLFLAIYHQSLQASFNSAWIFLAGAIGSMGASIAANEFLLGTTALPSSDRPSFLQIGASSRLFSSVHHKSLIFFQEALIWIVRNSALQRRYLGIVIVTLAASSIIEVITPFLIDNTFYRYQLLLLGLAITANATALSFGSGQAATRTFARYQSKPVNRRTIIVGYFLASSAAILLTSYVLIQLVASVAFLSSQVILMPLIALTLFVHVVMFHYGSSSNNRHYQLTGFLVSLPIVFLPVFFYNVVNPSLTFLVLLLWTGAVGAVALRRKTT